MVGNFGGRGYNLVLIFYFICKGISMPTVKDVVVKKPSDQEIAVCKGWPTWSCEPSKFDWAYTQTETCLILEGEVTVSDGTDSVSFGVGDYVVFPNGLECVWEVTKAVRKHYDFS